VVVVGGFGWWWWVVVVGGGGWWWCGVIMMGCECGVSFVQVWCDCGECGASREVLCSGAP
jgi:hypothetical protein